MIKSEEVKDLNSCLNKAKSSEMLFVLRAHDIAAPQTIRYWVAERIRLAKNKLEDQVIQEALTCANLMEDQKTRGY